MGLIRKAGSMAMGVAEKGLKFGGACALGTLAVGTAIGHKTYGSMNNSLKALENGLMVGMINSFSLSKFEEQVALSSHQQQQGNKGRQAGFDWAMASAYGDNGAQYGG